MYSLYGLLFLMMLVAIGFIAYPFMRHRALTTRAYWLTVIFVIVFVSGAYQFTGDPAALKQWITQGNAHYQLLEKFQQLGGIDGAIQRIEDKLEKNPNDFQGWVILGKLYFSKQDYARSAAALSRAHQLQPQDASIEHFYEIARDANKQQQAN